MSRSKIIPQSGFKLSKSSVVCINNHFLAAELESVLLELGIQVVPYEFALQKAIQTEEGSNSDDGYVKKSESYSGTEIPAAIFIKIDGYDSMQFRFMDMKTQRLLAVYKYSVDPNYHSLTTKSPLKRFKKDILPYIVN